MQTTGSCAIISLIAALLIVTPVWMQTSANAADTSRPNIVFILADDLGINDLSCYGRKDQLTPHLDRLATEGMRFTSAYCAQPICSPSRAAIMTGMHPARLHLTTFLPGRADAPSQKLLHPKIAMQLPLEETTVAEELSAAGYATACVGKWHLGGARFGPKEQGFQFVHEGKANTSPDQSEGGKGEYDLTRAAIRFVEDHVAAHKDQPFFLYLPHNNPHIPLAAKQELIEKHRGSFNPVYAAAIETLDDSVGQLLAKLDELKLTENTIVIFTADNGGLHVLESPDSPATHNTPFRAGKGFVYEGGLRIPLIVRFPGVVPPGQTSDVPVINTDWAPTLLALCGVESQRQFDGLNVEKVLRGEAVAERSFLWHFPHYTNQGSRPAGAVRDGDWKLVEHYDTGVAELYNLSNDIGEHHDVAGQHADRVASMREQLAAWRQEIGAQQNQPNPDFDASLFAKLYVETDVSKLQPATTAAEMRPGLKGWRQQMNAVLPRANAKK
jgi:arylsulfatase A